MDLNGFIDSVTSNLGVSEPDARKATGGMLGAIKGAIGDGDFSQLLDQIPGASQVMEQSTAAGNAEKGGILGGLMDTAAGAIGGKLGSAIGVMGALSDAGLDPERGGSFVSMFVDFLKENVDADLVGRVLENVPDLRKMLG